MGDNIPLFPILQKLSQNILSMSAAILHLCNGDQVWSGGIMLPSIHLPPQSAQLSIITFHHQNQSYENIHQCLVTNSWCWVWQNSKILTADPAMVISLLLNFMRRPTFLLFLTISVKLCQQSFFQLRISQKKEHSGQTGKWTDYNTLKMVIQSS